MTAQTEKSISDLLASIGVTHAKVSANSDLHWICVPDGVVIDAMDAHQAANFYRLAQAAA